MANGTDAEDFVVLSRVKPGRKREFEFAWKSRSEICGSLGRTRSRSAQNATPETPEIRSTKKLKKAAKIKKENEREASDLETPVRVVEDSADLMSEEEAKSDIVDVDEPKSDGDGELTVPVCEDFRMMKLPKEDEVNDGVVEPMCEDEIEKGREEKDEPMKEVTNLEEEENDLEGASKIDIEEKEKERERASTSLVKENNPEGEPEKETESERALRNAEDLSCEGDNGQDDKKDDETGKAMMNVIGEEGEKDRGIEANPGRELINGEEETFKGTLEVNGECQKGDLIAEGSSKQVQSRISGRSESKIENVLLEEKSLKRFTRSSLKTKGEPVKGTAARAVIEEAEVKSGDDGNVEDLITPVKQETKASMKFARNVPTKLKDLLLSGMLEGSTVKYVRRSKGVRGSGVSVLQGVIKGYGVLCFCHACKGINVVTPTVYEVHAGSANKRPTEYIYLENGNSLRDVMNACKANSLTQMEEALRMVIGSSMKNSNFCLNCKGSMTGVGSGKPRVLCDSCVEFKYHQDTSVEVAVVINGSPKPTAVPKSPFSASKSSSSQTRIHGRVTRKDLRMHKLVFEADALPDGAELTYFVRGQKMLIGYKKGYGIFCTCCNSEVSPSQFEAHAGWATRRKPFQHIYTSNGVSLHELSISLSKKRKVSLGENDDLCSICLDGGDLLCCDTCPRAYHTECVSLPSIPTGAWYCRYCQNTFQKEKFVEHNANAVAAGRIAGIDPIEQITHRCIRIMNTPETEDLSVCVLCRGHDFSRSGFGPRTVILCDQCEREYHVGCLRDHKMDDLKELPEGKWFCCSDCNRIDSALQKLVLHGSEKLPDSSLTFVKKKHEEHILVSEPNLEVRWRVLSGKMASSDDNRVLLSKAVAIFHERFDPISDSGSSKGDLIPSMVYGRTVRGQDFGGMYCAILTVNEVVVSAGIFRIFGQEVAELPLVATSTESQGKGYFQCLFTCIEKLLGFLNVQNLVLPAAEEAKSIWTNKFGFCKITQDDLKKYKRDYQIMIFQGTSMLGKPVPRVAIKSEGS